MKTTRYFVLFLLIFTTIFQAGCRKKTIDIAAPAVIIDGTPSVASMSGQSISFSADQLQFSVDLYVVNKNGQHVAGLTRSNFSISKTSTLTYTLNDVKSVGQTAKAGYSAMMLLDQSGSISSSDPNNLRIEASKIFIKSLGAKDNAALSSFSGSSIFYHRGFSRDTLMPFKTLDSLRGRVGGGTPLYESAILATNYTALKAPNENKALLAFTDGEDTGYSSIAAVIANSLKNNIPIYSIGLSNSVDEVVLSQMANETGGAFFWAKDAKQLVTSFGTLGNLLHGSARLYRTSWTVRRSSGTWRVGDVVTGTIVITLPTGELVDSAFYFKVK